MPAQKLSHIDAARGIAILLVILVHHTQAVARVMPLDPITLLIGGYGQMGVQLFFIASAITLCLSQDSRRTEEAPIRSFYLRRFFRIAPLYYLAILIYGAVYWFRHGALGAYTIGNVAANLLFVHGFVPSAINDIVPGGWSIGGEMAFYAVFPFVFAVAASIDKRWGPVPIALGAVGMFAAYVAAWFVIPLVTPFAITRNNIFYYWPPAQAPVFALGIAAYFLFRRVRTPLWADATGFVVGTGISLALWGSGYRGAFAIIPGCSAISFIALINMLAKLPERQTPLHAIGRASYSMYVLHFLAAWFVAPLIIKAVAPSVSGWAVVVLTFPVTVAVAFAAASLTKRLIEDRGIAWGRATVRALQSRRESEVAVA